MLDIFFIVSLIVAFVGTAYASYSDLKTTEVSDWVPVTMASIGILINGLHSFVSWNYIYIAYSVGIGLAFLAFGVAMYKLGQWGGADAAILAALGTLVPFIPGFTYFGLAIPYQISLVLNVYILGAIYAFFYAFVVAFRKKGTFTIFIRDLNENKGIIAKYFFALIGVVLFVSALFSYMLGDMKLFVASLSSQAYMIPLFLLLLVYWRFAKVIESHVFKWKVSTKNLKEGDMLAEDVKVGKKTISSKYLEGLTKIQVQEIRKYKSYVTIKEGIRFVPAFLFGFLFTIAMALGWIRV